MKHCTRLLSVALMLGLLAGCGLTHARPSFYTSKEGAKTSKKWTERVMPGPGVIPANLKFQTAYSAFRSPYETYYQFWPNGAVCKWLHYEREPFKDPTYARARAGRFRCDGNAIALEFAMDPSEGGDFFMHVAGTIEADGTLILTGENDFPASVLYTVPSDVFRPTTAPTLPGNPEW